MRSRSCAIQNETIFDSRATAATPSAALVNTNGKWIGLSAKLTAAGAGRMRRADSGSGAGAVRFGSLLHGQGPSRCERCPAGCFRWVAWRWRQQAGTSSSATELADAAADSPLRFTARRAVVQQQSHGPTNVITVK